LKIKAYESVQVLKGTLNKYEAFGTPLYESRIGENNEFIVYEQFSLANSNRMSISIVLEEKEGYTLIHFITSGSSQGWLFKFDWGSGNRRKNRIQSVLLNNHIKYEIIGD
jgi:hypothetical protein